MGRAGGAGPAETVIGRSATAILGGPGVKTLNQRNLTIDSNAILSGTAILSSGALDVLGATVTNEGTFVLQGGNLAVTQSLILGNSQFVNHGVFQQTQARTTELNTI